MTRPPPRSPLFPYTTLSRSEDLTRVLKVVESIKPLSNQRDQHRRIVDVLRKNAATWRRTANAVRGFGSPIEDRKSTRLNSSHANISYAVFCLKKKKNTRQKN